jgi:hypothetical protein
MTSQNLNKLLLVLSVVYLAHEFAFNSELISVPLQNAHNLEMFGRALAGFGGALLAVRLVAKKTDNVIAFAVTFLLAGMVVFVTQKAMVEKYVDSTTGQERADAQDLTYLNYAFQGGMAKVPGLPDDIAKSTVRTRAWSTIFALNTWKDPERMELIRADRLQIGRAVTGKQAVAKVDQGFEEYKKGLAVYAEAAQQAEHMAQEAEQMAPQIAQLIRSFEKNIQTTRFGGESYKNWTEIFRSKSMKMTGHVVPHTVFCDERPVYGYVMGRKQETGIMTDCATSPDEITARLRGFLKEQLNTGVADNLPAALKGIDLDPSKPLTLAEWREKVGGKAFEVIDRQFAANFKTPASYANGGEHESEGKSYARAVVVPPIAIAFSLFFAVLNGTVLLVQLLARRMEPTKARGVTFAAVGILLVLPLLLGHDVMMDGIPGLVTKWVVTMEGWIYPLGHILGYVTI